MKQRSASAGDDLFQLIHSLTKTEKRYFKLFAGPDKETIYLMLFNAIITQKRYDEGALKEAFKEYSTVNNFHIVKKYLFDLIMDSLLLFHKDSTINLKLKMLLQQIEICNSKGLYDTSFRLLRRAEKIANEYERVVYLPEIYTLQKINLLDLTHKRYSNNDRNEIAEKEKDAFVKISNASIYRNTIVELLSEYVKWEGIRNPSMNSVFRQIENDPLFMDEKNAVTTEAKMLYYSIKGYYHHEKAEYLESMQFRKKVIALLQNNHPLKKVFQRNYLITLYNLNIDLRMLKRYDEMRENIEVFAAYPAVEFRTAADQFRRYHILKSQLIMDTGAFSEVYQLEAQFFDHLPEYKETITNAVLRMIKFNFALCYFGGKKYNECLSRFLDIINEPKSEQEVSIYGQTLIWMMFTHFEMKNFELLPYLAKSAKRYFLKNKILFRPEQMLFQFFNNIKHFEHAAAIEHFRFIYDYINNNITASEDKNLYYTSISRWLESKISNQPLEKIIQQQLLNF